MMHSINSSRRINNSNQLNKKNNIINNLKPNNIILKVLSKKIKEINNSMQHNRLNKNNIN